MGFAGYQAVIRTMYEAERLGSLSKLSEHGQQCAMRTMLSKDLKQRTLGLFFSLGYSLKMWYDVGNLEKSSLYIMS
jgi:hypothetical protein